MSAKSIREQEQNEACKELRKLLKPGQVIYTILRHVSSSGMFRVIDLAIVVPDIATIYPRNDDGTRDYDNPIRKKVGHKIRSIGYLAAQAMGDKWHDKNGISAGGCGMDMGFHLVYSLGRTLYPKGVRCTGDERTCQSNDHVNPGEDRNRYDRRIIHGDSGYAFKQTWL